MGGAYTWEGLIYGGLIYGQDVVLVILTINNLLTLFLYNTRLIDKQA